MKVVGDTTGIFPVRTTTERSCELAVTLVKADIDAVLGFTSLPMAPYMRDGHRA